MTVSCERTVREHWLQAWRAVLGATLLVVVGCGTFPEPQVPREVTPGGQLTIRVVREEFTHADFELVLEYEHSDPVLLAHVSETRRYFPQGRTGPATLAYHAEWWEWFSGERRTTGAASVFHLRWDVLRNASVGPWLEQMGRDFECEIVRTHEYYVGGKVSGTRNLESDLEGSKGQFGILSEGPTGAAPLEQATLGSGADARVVFPRTLNPLFVGNAGSVMSQGRRVGSLSISLRMLWTQLVDGWSVSWMSGRRFVVDGQAHVTITGAESEVRTPWKEGPRLPDLPSVRRNEALAPPKGFKVRTKSGTTR